MPHLTQCSASSFVGVVSYSNLTQLQQRQICAIPSNNKNRTASLEATKIWPSARTVAKAAASPLSNKQLAQSTASSGSEQSMVSPLDIPSGAVSRFYIPLYLSSISN